MEMVKWAWQFMLNMIVFRDALDKDLTTTGLAGRGKEKGLPWAKFTRKTDPSKRG